jgi:hypothetical protein
MAQSTQPKPPRKNSNVLTPPQAEYVDKVLNNLPLGSNASNYNKTSKVIAEIERARQELSDKTTLKRLDTINGILEAIEMARVIADPGVMIKGWVEIGKILGHYAPEVKKIEITTNQRHVRHQLESMSDEDLLAIIDDQAVQDAELVEEVLDLDTTDTETVDETA